MAKRNSLPNSPIVADKLTPSEQKFFDTQGEEGGPETPGPTPAPVTPVAEPEDVSRETTEAPEVETAPETPQPPKQKMVPHQALHEAREELKEWKQRAKTLEERTNQLFERTLNQPAPQPVPQQQLPQNPPPPDPNEDPMGALMWSIKTVADRQAEIDNRFKQQDEQTRMGGAVQQLQTMAMTDENEFKAETPDYDAAAQHLQTTRLQEFKAMGYNQMDAINLIRQEAMGLAARAFQQGKRPAQVIYEMAKLRGYKAAAPTQETVEETAQAEVQAQVATGQQKLATVATGQRQSANLSQVSGAAPAAMNATKLAAMSPEEFSAYANDPKNKAMFRDMMGR